MKNKQRTISEQTSYKANFFALSRIYIKFGNTSNKTIVKY